MAHSQYASVFISEENVRISLLSNLDKLGRYLKMYVIHQIHLDILDAFEA